MNRCPNHQTDLHDVTAAEGSALCLNCGDRLWQEIHWLADMYDHLFKALTHRLNVEKAEQVKVQGGKDPMVRGLDMNDDAATLRHDIRGIAYAGLGWLYQRNPDFRGQVDPEMDVPRVLRFLARHLHWITSDLDPVRIGHWGSRVVAARQWAELLVTPATGHRVDLQGVSCQHQHEDTLCGGGLYTYTEDTSVVLCGENPAHTVSRETAIRAAIRGRIKHAPARRLAGAILRGTK